MRRSNLAVASAFGCALYALALTAAAQPPAEPSIPPWQAATHWPDRIVVTIEEDPASSFAVSWRTLAEVDGARAEIVLAGDHSRIDLDATSVDARSVRPDLDSKHVDGEDYALRWNTHLEQPAYHTVTFSGLEPDTAYAYRVMGAEDHWSEWFHTRTAPPAGTPFRFLYFGDAQDGISSHWPRVARAAYATAPDARFAIHAGDLVNIASRDFEWAAWFRAVGFIHGMIPALPLVGNHEYFDGISREEGGAVNALSVLWRPQFALPKHAELPEALLETVYTVRYGDAQIVALDTMGGYFEEQALWLDDVLLASDAKWKIVTMHHPLFELVQRRYDDGGPERRDAFLPVFERHGVDIVLQGHDHSYGRGATYDGPRTPNASRLGDLGTVFVTSSAGAKMYGVDGWDGLGEEYGAILQRVAENTPFFQIISLDGDSLTYEARTATGRLYDAFRLDKPRNGRNELVELPTEIDAERRFDNTHPYENTRYDTVPAAP
jgi:hypothetical protein